MRYLLVLLVLIFSNSCNDSKTLSYIELETPLMNAICRSDYTDPWVRSPQNLTMLNETFKEIGYDYLITDELLDENPFIFYGIYINRPLRHLLDTLEISYGHKVEDKYFNEFWQRRRLEKNEVEVYGIVRDLNLFIKTNATPGYNNKVVNDTLYNLAKMDKGECYNSNEAAKGYFYTLKNYGLHQSAYNLLYEREEYHHLNWDRQELLNQLQESKVSTYGCWVDDNTP